MRLRGTGFVQISLFPRCEESDKLCPSQCAVVTSVYGHLMLAISWIIFKVLCIFETIERHGYDLELYLHEQF